MRSPIPVASAVTLCTAILAAPAILAAQVCPGGYFNSVTVTINTTGSADDGCVNKGGTITFVPQNAGDIFTAIFLSSSPFNDGHRINATGFNTNDTIASGAANGFKYIACYYASGGTAPACTDPKIIVNPVGLDEVVIRMSKPNVVFRPEDPARSLTIENTGKSSVTIERIEKNGTARAKESFRITENCDHKPLPAGGVCTAEVTFTGKDRQTLTLVVKYQGGRQTNRITVTGEP